MIRRSYRPGDYLLVDDESGKTIWASEARTLWDGSIRHYHSFETRHPQEFVKAKNDPKSISDISVEAPLPTPSNIVPIAIGQTNVLTRTGPASHLFGFGVLGGGDPGIGQMVIGASAESSPFFVRYS